MKNGMILKKILVLTILVVGTIICIISCSSEKGKITKEDADEKNKIKFDDANKEKEAQFLVEVTEINFAEIKLGQLAQQSSKMDRVKELGKMMESAHTKCLTDLTSLAYKKSIVIPTLPTSKVEEEYEKLSSKSDANFDKDYCNMMISGHKNAIAKFEKASVESTDTDIKVWIKTVLPELHNHLDHAISCQEECNKME